MMLVLVLAFFQEDPSILIERLRSERIEEREEAAKRLNDLGAAVAPALKAATKDRDPELAGRARGMLEEMGKRVHRLLEDGKADEARILLENVENLHARRDEYKRTPLHVASRHGPLSIAALLVKQGADVNAVAYNDFRPLHKAANFGHLDIVRLLLSHGASVEARGAGSTALEEAASSGHRAIVQALIETGAVYTLQAALSLSDAGRVRDLLSNDPSLARGQGILHRAAQGGNGPIVKLLLEHGADPNDPRTIWEEPPLLWALEHPEAVRLLLDKGADAKVRLRIKGIDFGTTLLHVAAERGHLESAKLLIDHGAEVEAVRVEDGKETVFTPLHAAACGGHPRLVSLLLDRKADLTRRAWTGQTALELAGGAIRPADDDGEREENCRRAEVVRILADRSLATDLFTAIAVGDETRVEAMLKEKPEGLRVKDAEGNPALHRAISLDHRAIVRKLLDSGADLQARGRWGRTPLHEAVFWRRPELVRVLLDRRADRTATDDHGRTPLAEAENVRERRPSDDEMILLLKERGAK